MSVESQAAVEDSINDSGETAADHCSSVTISGALHISCLTEVPTSVLRRFDQFNSSSTYNYLWKRVVVVVWPFFFNFQHFCYLSLTNSKSFTALRYSINLIYILCCQPPYYLSCFHVIKRAAANSVIDLMENLVLLFSILENSVCYGCTLGKE